MSSYAPTVAPSRFTLQKEVQKGVCGASFVDPSNRVVISVCSGVVTLKDVKSSYAEIKANPGFRPDFSQLIDL